MTSSTDRAVRWTRGVGLVSLGLVACVLVPADLFWAVAAAAGLIGGAIATVALFWSRWAPTLAEVIARAQAEPALVPVVGGRGDARGARLRQCEGRNYGQ